MTDTTEPASPTVAVQPPPPPPIMSRVAIVSGIAGSGLAVDQLTPTVNWILDGFPTGARPDSTAGLVAAVLLTIAAGLYHVAVAIYRKKFGAAAIPTSAGS